MKVLFRTRIACNGINKSSVRTLNDLTFRGRRVLVRVDLNLPMNPDGTVADDTRLCAILPTLQHILQSEGRPILLAHMGRPEGAQPQYSFQPLQAVLHAHCSALIGYERLVFAGTLQEAQERAARLRKGEVLLLQNLRFYAEETAADEAFAQRLASLGDLYVNEAFSCSHRAHASITLLPRHFEERGIGYAFHQEIEALRKFFERPKRPAVLVLGGRKITDKVALLARLIPSLDHILVGGCIAHTFAAEQGGRIGQSFHEPEAFPLISALLGQAEREGTTFHLPADALAAPSAGAPSVQVQSTQIPPQWQGLDIGAQAQEHFAQQIARGASILWNGPMGLFEEKDFSAGTKCVALAMARAARKDAYTVVGGGDTLSALRAFGLQGAFSHASTGGGAMLAFLEHNTLPGLLALSAP